MDRRGHRARAFALLAACSQAAPGLRLGTGVLALQLRTPPLAAMAAATLQALRPDRDVWLGIGISSPVVAGQWHGAGYGDRPLAQVVEYLSLVKACLSGERVDFEGDFYNVSRFRLGVRLGERRPKVVVGALNPGMLRVAGKHADGVLLNYLPATHVAWSVEQIRAGGDATRVRLRARWRYGPGVGRRPARADLFSYAVVDSYAANFARAGYGDVGRRGARAARGQGPRRRARRGQRRVHRRHRRCRRRGARSRHGRRVPRQRRGAPDRLPAAVGRGPHRRNRGHAAWRRRRR